MMNIKTNRLEINRFKENDVRSYSEIMIKPEVTRFLGNGTPWLKEEAEKRAEQKIKFINECIKEKGFGVYAVRESSTGQLIGHCGFQKLEDGRLEFLYAYDPSVWGKGYAQEAGKALLDYARENFCFPELIGLVYPENEGSINVLKKLGFKKNREEEFFGKMLNVFLLER